MPPRRSATKLPELTNVQILRGIAALFVVLYHVPDELADRGWDSSIFPVMWVGSAGVDIFFVISGFIMVYSTVGLFRQPRASMNFFLRRLARIVPLYWIFTTIAVFVTIRGERHLDHPDYTIPHFIASYLFTFYLRPGFDDFPIYRQGWSLNYEMFFYVCFALALMLSRPRALVALSMGFVALVGLGVAALHGLISLPWPIEPLANSDLLEFVLGMVLAQLYLKGYRVPRPVAIAGAFAALMTIMLTTTEVAGDWFPYRGFVWGPPAALLVASAVMHEPLPTGAVRRSFEALGDASYSLYLVHSAFFMMLFWLLGHVMDVHRIPALWAGALMLFGAIGSALLLYRYVERPITRALQRWLRRVGPGVDGHRAAPRHATASLAADPATRV
ncbi:MAG TPA: acyltransferase [Lichenihabitans sp.]|jgi:peptidoglycan/LPS O-acetylase OafA/YrhL|nr:acyltransferase [Lichenihabitans sp.]